MSEWTPQERKIKTPNGIIFYGGPCKDDYENMEVYDQPPEGQGLILKLQSPAMTAFKAAEVRFGEQTGRPAKWRPILVLPGTNRTCSTQRTLRARDPGRYADPDVTGHTRGLAIDVSQAQPRVNLDIIHECLTAEGWERVRPDDEPWHYSFGVMI